MVESPTFRKWPLVSIYKDTEQENFPLILWIGKELDSCVVVGEVGYYDLYMPRAGLRSFAYAMLAYSKNTSIRFLKGLCKLKRSSPLVFASIVPVSVRTNVEWKDTAQARARRKDYVRHVRRLVASKIFERSVMVVLWGLEMEEYKEAAGIIEAECRTKSKTLVKSSVPYTNKSEKWIRVSFSRRNCDVAAIIFDRWLHYQYFQYLERYGRKQFVIP